MDQSSAQAGTAETAGEVGPNPRRVKFGSRLIAAGFLIITAGFLIGSMLFSRDLTSMNYVGPAQIEAIKLDRGSYLIYEEYSSSSSDIAIAGDSGLVTLGDVNTTTKIDIDDFRARAIHSIDISSPGVYRVYNNGDGRIAIERPFVAKLVGFIVVPLVVGGLIIGTGMFVLAKEHARKSIQERHWTLWRGNGSSHWRKTVVTRYRRKSDGTIKETTTVVELSGQGEPPENFDTDDHENSPTDGPQDDLSSVDDA